MNKILFLVVAVSLACWSFSVRADSYALTDGNTLSGDMIKFDDTGVMVRQAGDVYTNISWTLLTQDALKQLAQNPKIGAIVSPLLEPDVTERPPKPAVTLHEVNRLKIPAQSSVLGGFFSSSVGLLMGLLLYAANLYAGYEIGVCRNRPPVMVVLISGILPIIAPVAFYFMPSYVQSDPEEEVLPEQDLPPTTVAMPGAAAAQAQGQSAGKSETQSARATWAADSPKKQQTQAFQRGKFVFNKRFIETKFGLFLKGPSKDVVLVIITPAGQFIANRIGEITPSEMQIFCDTGEAQIPFADIQEAQIKPRPQ